MGRISLGKIDDIGDNEWLGDVSPQRVGKALRALDCPVDRHPGALEHPRRVAIVAHENHFERSVRCEHLNLQLGRNLHFL